ncbi:hypothetical protein [Hymenobacter sp. B81]|uniref:hypothetical protein n=1 Tax=Hymenobacter sp. B81 TaxID=3344878 RepID=UPI0037DC331D
MMEALGRVNFRSVWYLDAVHQPSWPAGLPPADWLLFVIADHYDYEQLIRVAAECMKRQPAIVCSAGLCAVEADYVFDEEIVAQARAWEVRHGAAYNYEYGTQSTIHYDFDEGFWFATAKAQHARQSIHLIVCLDLSGRYKERILELLQRINDGWLPPAPDYDQGKTVRIM